MVAGDDDDAVYVWESDHNVLVGSLREVGEVVCSFCSDV